MEMISGHKAILVNHWWKGTGKGRIRVLKPSCGLHLLVRVLQSVEGGVGRRTG